MAEQTVREQLAEALEAHPLGFENHHPHLETPYDHECATCRFWRLGRDALARHRAEPEGGDFKRREALLVALDELFEGGHTALSPSRWRAAREAFKAAESELQCPDGCDTSCRCYQEGLEAQRERVGGGTA